MPAKTIKLFNTTITMLFNKTGIELSNKNVFGITNIFITTTISMIGSINVDRKLLFLNTKAEMAAVPSAPKKIGLLNILNNMLTKIDQLKPLVPIWATIAINGELYPTKYSAIEIPITKNIYVVNCDIFLHHLH